jgi:uncharacterized membrane protein YeaQ/YmgE (transglycosylase-associated protein family)
MYELATWCVVGFIAGGLARRVVGAPKRGCLATIVVGVLGAVLGGAIWRFASGDHVDDLGDLRLGSVLVAFLGATALLLVLQAIDGGGARHRRNRRY